MTTYIYIYTIKHSIFFITNVKTNILSLICLCVFDPYYIHLELYSRRQTGGAEHAWTRENVDLTQADWSGRVAYRCIWSLNEFNWSPKNKTWNSTGVGGVSSSEISCSGPNFTPHEVLNSPPVPHRLPSPFKTSSQQKTQGNPWKSAKNTTKLMFCTHPPPPVLLVCSPVEVAALPPKSSPWKQMCGKKMLLYM